MSTIHQSLRLALLAFACVLAAPPSGALPQDDEAELEQLLREERAEADLARRRGEVRSALRTLDRHLDEEPADAESRALRALCRLDQAEYDEALADAARAFEDAAPTDGQVDPDLLRFTGRVLGELHLLQGRGREALEVLDAANLSPAHDARDAWVYGRTLIATGDRAGGLRVLTDGARMNASGRTWDQVMAKALCQRHLGDIERASRTLVAADEVASQGEGTEPDVLVALGDIYFEGDKEVAVGSAQSRSPARLYKEALEICPKHEGALLGLFRLHRYNWRRSSRSATDILDELLAVRPDSIEGLIAGASSDLDDGQLRRVRGRLEKLGELSPGRREVRTIQAALAWVEHRREDCEEILTELTSHDPQDSYPEREVGRHLLELYRFAEGLPFLERAVKRDPRDHDAWTHLGRALANTGDEKRAREALETAEREAGRRQDAWRNNMLMVLRRIETECIEETYGDFTFAWRSDAAPVLRTYLVPHYEEARELMARRYGYTPGPVRIEVFRRHADFSVRSTGFEGFPALGVCFGPVVTAVSPLSGMRGNFSWARTSFHEYTHVTHLGLSHNRCPRWITEGLATWEEVERNPSWTRNMRRDLIDAFHSDNLIRVRDLNRAFRGPRILFGYYQGGLLCDMLIDEHGFPPMVRLLEAFDRGLDLDAAFKEVFDTTPEEVDARFLEYVAAYVGELELEPRWRPFYLQRLQLRLSRTAPEDAREAAAWAEDWCKVAWGAWQTGRKIDAQEALRILSSAGLQPPRAMFLRAEIALSNGERKEARELWQAGLDAGGEDYRVRIALGTLALEARDTELAESHYLRATEVFPGFAEEELAAELRLASLYRESDRYDDAMRIMAAWLDHNSGHFHRRMELARWHFNNDRFDEALRMFTEANEVDPFSRALHKEWGEALRLGGRLEEALREFEVAMEVPPDLDIDEPGPLEGEERADLIAWQALCLFELGRREEARERADQALKIDPECPLAQDVVERLK